MAKSKVSSKGTPRQEPIEDVSNNISKARDIALDLSAKVHVFGQLLLLKRNDNGDYTFYDGLNILNNELGDKISDVIDILDFAETKAGLCKTDEEKIKAGKKRIEEARRYSVPGLDCK